MKTELRRQEVICPFCGKIQDNDDLTYPVTFWGEDDPVGFECDNEDCGKEFLVKEHVDRRWSTYDSLESFKEHRFGY